MKVAVYYNNKDIRIEERPVPKIGPDELLVKVVASGICGSDVLEWYRIKKAPLVLGHEISGEIVEAGAAVKKYKAGQQVFVSHHVPCNGCHHCLAGHHTACHTLHTTNYDPGGFAEFLRVPAINVDRGTFVLPDEVSFEQGAMIEPLACVLRGQRLARFTPGQSLLVLGSGISGLLHIMAAKACGGGKVFATDISAFRLAAAKAQGADVTLNAKDDLTAAIRAQNAGRLADLIIVATGALPAFKQALQCIEPGGTVLFFACPQPGIDLAVPLNEFWRNEIKLLPSYGAAPYDITEAIELIRAKRLAPEKIITHRLGLKDAALGFKLTAEPKDSLKVIIVPHKKEVGHE